MSRRKQITVLISGVFLLSIAWGMLILAKTLLKTNENNNLNYLPENVTFAIRLDGRELAEKTLFSVFIESKDEEVLELIRSLLKKETTQKSEFRNLGIDYVSDILLFKMELENRTVSGILFNVSNPGLFKKGLEDTPAAYACTEDVGIVLFDSDTRPLGNERLTLYAERMLRKPTDAIQKLEIVHHQSGTFFEIFSNGQFLDSESSYKQSDIHFGLDDRMLFINGKLELQKEATKKMHYLKKTLKPKGFHFSGSELPKMLGDSLNNWLKQFGKRIPEMNAISLNLSGTKIINHSSGFFVVPQMQLYIETSKPFSIDAFLSNQKMVSYFDYEKDSNSIKFQNERLYFKQVTPNSFYLGVSQNPEFVEQHGKDLILIKGNISPLMHIEGGGLMTSFLEMIPEYRASKQLSEHIDTFEMTVRRTSGKFVLLQGKMVFGNDYHPMNEIIKFLLTGEFISK